ncbi:hypothetical protein AMC84_CH02661 [Rhizobium phaseoli]|nr:hypothetical protein AMC84_CH02661 [Rhizobium phaseoli]
MDAKLATCPLLPSGPKDRRDPWLAQADAGRQMRGHKAQPPRQPESCSYPLARNAALSDSRAAASAGRAPPITPTASPSKPAVKSTSGVTTS